MQSMTAFAALERDNESGTFSWELRSVNHRYLDLTVRLPDRLRTLEPLIRKQLARRVRRGKCECVLKYSPPPGQDDLIGINKTRLAALLKAMNHIAGTLARTTPPNTLDILTWPGIMDIETIDQSEICEQANLLFTDLINAFLKARASEGEQIKPLIEARCQKILDEVAQLEPILPEILERHRLRLQERVAMLTSHQDEERIAQEIAIIAQRQDVDEELDRISLHVKEVLNLLDSSEPIGRRLDFLMQELNREANTLSSKAQDIRQTRTALEIKVLIEQIREQIQNVE